jgi:DNA-binding NtrC family response regulator
MAGGGRQALELITQKGPYAVIMSDLRMPQMSGLDFLKKAKELCPNAVCLLLTGNTEIDDDKRISYSGLVFRIIGKPVPIRDLAAILDEAIEEYRNRLEHTVQ